MSQSRKNRLDVDGGEVPLDDNVESYKPILETDKELKSSKPNLSKSKEKLSSDGAEEKLLQREDEAKITRVDMADATYVVGDHRNGDAKIELDANKKQFSGLTKEELLQYANDPFWVRLRWFMFVAFWALWLCMLVGAIVIIVQAPKCAPPAPLQWFEKGPLVDISDLESLEKVEDSFSTLSSASVQGIFISGELVGDTYSVIGEDNHVLDNFKTLAKKAKDAGLRVIVDLTANFVSKSHEWFTLSENRTGNYTDYFVWARGTDFDETGSSRRPPNNWVSKMDTPAWSKSATRGEFYLHQLDSDRPDLNFSNPLVVKHFDDVLRNWIKAGATGVRLLDARGLIVNSSLPDEIESNVPGYDHSQYGFWKHRHTTDQPALSDLLQHWAHIVRTQAAENGSDASLFTLKEDGFLAEYGARRGGLQPPSGAPVSLVQPADKLVELLNMRLASQWPALQLKSVENIAEVGSFALLLPAAPVLTLDQLTSSDNDTAPAEWLSRLLPLRSDASVSHGNTTLLAVPAHNTTQLLLACFRWKAGHTGYGAVWNPNEKSARANLTGVSSVPDTLTVHHVTPAVYQLTNYTSNQQVARDDLLVPPKSTVILSYVPKTDK